MRELSKQSMKKMKIKNKKIIFNVWCQCPFYYIWCEE